jgi:uncharacterized protein YecE (DUF72 family)
MKWWIGCSGFYYKHWKEIFYPQGLPQKRWFEFYCEHFNTLELNVTFYRFPQLSFLESWHDRSPEIFKFAVKAPRGITHFKQFHGTEKLISEFYEVVKEGLKKKLGCVLFQLPPRIGYDPERLERIINSLDPQFHNVLEFRHPSWWNAEVYRQLAKNKISFSGMSHPTLPDEVIQNTPIVYYRLHGVHELYKSPYTMKELRRVVNDIAVSPRVKHAFIYFNNDIGGNAIKNAKEMKTLVTSTSVV